MLLDNKLIMSQQIDNMYKRANMRLGILCEIKDLLQKKQRLGYTKQ